MVKKTQGLAVLLLMFVVLAAGCGAQKTTSETPSTTTPSATAQAGTPAAKTKTVTYLGKQYQVPENPQKITVLAVEALEEMHILGVKPYAAASDMYVNGIPQEVGDTLANVQWVTSGVQPDKEQLLKLKPDLILTSARMDPESLKPLEQIAPTIPLSFSGADSEANIKLVGELTGKTDDAAKVIEAYKKQVAAAKAQIGDTFKDKKIMYLRISTQNGLGAYSKDTTYNAVLYDGLGLTIPEVIAPIQRREGLALEKLAQANPDYIFALVPLNDLKAIDDLKAKPLWNQIQAVKDGHVIVNPVHPDLFGTPLLSKKLFLEQVTKTLTNGK